MWCLDEREREKTQQRLSGARNNDGSNVTSNKFNEITYNFPNEHKKTTIQIVRHSIECEIVFWLISFLVRKKNRKYSFQKTHFEYSLLKNTIVFDSNYDCCVFSYQIIWLRRRFWNIITCDISSLPCDQLGTKTKNQTFFYFVIIIIEWK